MRLPRNHQTVARGGNGGGIGMTIVENEVDMVKAFESTRQRSERTFASARVFIEPFWPDARHIEVQVLGMPDGRVIALGDRDCSVQRRHQKVVEEAPADHLNSRSRTEMAEAAIRVAESVQYINAGTVEFLYDNTTGRYMFLEMNTRIQVEHAVTELVTGLDLVEHQLLIAMGASPLIDVDQSGHALELRIYAENPETFLPRPGRIDFMVVPTGPGVRVENGKSHPATHTAKR